MLVPIVVVIIAVIDGLLGAAGPIGGSMRVPPTCTPIMFLLATLLIAGLIIRTKAREPKG